MINNNFRFHFRLDTRRSLKGGNYPIQLFLYSKAEKKDIRIILKANNFEVKANSVPDEFERVWGRKNNLEFKITNIKNYRLREFLLERESKINFILKNSNINSLKQFKDAFQLENQIKDNDIIKFLHKKIILYNKERRYSYANSYKTTISKIKEFIGKDCLKFYDIDVKWLKNFEKFTINSNISKSSLGFYLKNIRTAFNEAIGKKIIPKEIYPFGSKRYIISGTTKKKNFLSLEELKKLKYCEPKDYFKQRAKDFFLFSFYSNGMTIKDIVFLQNDQFRKDTIITRDSNGNQVKIEREYFEFYKKNKKNLVQKKIKINISKEMVYIMDKYQNLNKGLENFVFDIIKSFDPFNQYKDYKNFNRVLNMQLKSLAIDLEINPKVSINWARHSMAVQIMDSGIPSHVLSNYFGHSSVSVTEGYLNSINVEFEDQIQKAKKI